MVPLYKALVRPIIEYANVVWNPYKRKHIDSIEKVQRHFTRCIIGMKNGLSYKERLGYEMRHYEILKQTKPGSTPRILYYGSFVAVPKSLLIAFGVVAMVLVYVLVININSDKSLMSTISLLQKQNSQPIPKQSGDVSHFKVQRNELSVILNDMKRQYGQQSCDMLDLQAKTNKGVNTEVSANGGWCSRVSGEDSTAHKWDKGLSTALSDMLRGKTVASFGDGPGMYKKHLDELKQVKSYIAYDGAPYCEKTTNGRVKFLDFTAPQFGLPEFDWVVSIEVGEHIPGKYEDIYLDNLARHAKEGIILSWAVPGQGGLSHVNNQPLTHVVKQMAKRHFSFDANDGKPLRDASTYGWLKNNIHVYKRADPSTFEPENV